MNTAYTYLRISVTDQCNLDCFYCRPGMRSRFLKDGDFLSFDEKLALVRYLAGRGIRHVRLTGGEPLLRKGICLFAKDISAIPELKFLSMTTNGVRLAGELENLKASGVNKINISLDTLKRDRFIRMSGKDELDRVRGAIVKAARMGFARVKLNCIVMRGFNDDEILDFVEFGSDNGLDVRFIEFFPTHGRCDTSKDMFVSSSEVKKAIERKFGGLGFIGSDPFSGPAQYFKLKGEGVRIGFISSVSDFFCGTCNRLRLTADGKLYPCLHSAYCADLKKPMRAGDTKEVSRLIDDVIADKRLFNRSRCERRIEMASIGG